MPDSQFLKNKKDNSLMAIVPKGKFTMGISQQDFDELLTKYEDKVSGLEELIETEIGKKEVFLPDYYIDIYPITNKQYTSFIKQTGRRKPEYFDDPLFNNSNQPVVGIGWEDAMAYAEWAGKRLATEVEWEKAARGSDERLWPWGSVFKLFFCNCAERGIGKTTPVDKHMKGKSPYGVCDMAGNVWEMCDGYWDNDSRVMKGGAFMTDSILCRTTTRWAAQDEKNGANWLGFRCGKDS